MAIATGDHRRGQPSRKALRVPPAWLLACLLLPVVATIGGSGSAHPFGSRYFAHRVVLRLEPDRASIEYLVEVPTSVVMREFYVTLSGRAPSTEEDARFTRDKLEALLDGLELRVDGRLLSWRNTTDPAQRNGVGDVNFFKYRLTATTVLDVEPGTFHRLEFYNYNYPAGEAYFNQELWVPDGVEVRAVSWWRSGKGDVAEDTAGQWSRDGRLRDLVMEFAVVRPDGGAPARVEPPGEVSPGPAASSVEGGARSYYVPEVEGVPLLPYLRKTELSLGLVLLALGLAVFFGAAHALSPGHGKTLVAAYLVGSKGTVKDAIILGLTVTVAHTAGVILLGAVTLFASAYVVPEKLFPVVEFVSGLLIVTIGLWMLRSRWRARAAGLHDADDHDVHGHGDAHDHQGEHTHGHSHWHGHGHVHGLPGGEVTIGQLLRLGVAGGMVPCPTALVVLLTAIALHRIVLGLALVVAFSVGLAVVLVVIGVVMVLAGSFMGRLSGWGKWAGRLPVISAALVTVLGIMVVGKSISGLAWVINFAGKQ